MLGSQAIGIPHENDIFIPLHDGNTKLPFGDFLLFCNKIQQNATFSEEIRFVSIYQACNWLPKSL
jgi:hypothetical protein